MVLRYVIFVKRIRKYYRPYIYIYVYYIVTNCRYVGGHNRLALGVCLLLRRVHGERQSTVDWTSALPFHLHIYILVDFSSSALPFCAFSFRPLIFHLLPPRYFIISFFFYCCLRQSLPIVLPFDLHMKIDTKKFSPQKFRLYLLTYTFKAKLKEES